MTTVAFVARRRRRRKPDALNFVRNFDGNPASAESRAFTNGIARRIETLAEMAGMDIITLEQEAGLAKGSIFSVLSGRRGGRTSIELVARVAIALGDVDIGFLVTGEFHVRDAPFSPARFVAQRRHRLPYRGDDPNEPALPMPRQTTFPGMVEYLRPQATALPPKKRRKRNLKKKPKAKSSR